MKEDENKNPYVHKFTRKYFNKKIGSDEGGLSPGLKLAGIIMISCIAVPLLLMGISFIAGLL